MKTKITIENEEFEPVKVEFTCQTKEELKMMLTLFYYARDHKSWKAVEVINPNCFFDTTPDDLADFCNELMSQTDFKDLEGKL